MKVSNAEWDGEGPEVFPYVLRERGASLAQLVGILGRSGYSFARLDGEAFSLDVPIFESKIADGSSIKRHCPSCAIA